MKCLTVGLEGAARAPRYPGVYAMLHNIAPELGTE